MRCLKCLNAWCRTRLVDLAKHFQFATYSTGWQADPATAVNISRLSKPAHVNPTDRIGSKKVVSVEFNNRVTCSVAKRSTARRGHDAIFGDLQWIPPDLCRRVRPSTRNRKLAGFKSIPNWITRGWVSNIMKDPRKRYGTRLKGGCDGACFIDRLARIGGPCLGTTLVTTTNGYPCHRQQSDG